jgi:hypothetical protein
VGVWGRSGGPVEHGLGRAEELAEGSEIPWPVEQQLRGPMGRGLACSTSCSLCKSWGREAFQELGVQSADVLALPCGLPQPSVSPESQQSPWFTELTQSAAVSQSPSWISCLKNHILKTVQTKNLVRLYFTKQACHGGAHL